LQFEDELRLNAHPAGMPVDFLCNPPPI